VASAFDSERHITLMPGTKATATPRGNLATLGDVITQLIHPLVIHLQRLVRTKGTFAAYWWWAVPPASFPLSFLWGPIAPLSLWRPIASWPRSFLLPFLRCTRALWARRFLRSFCICNQLEPPRIESLWLYTRLILQHRL
jgi:hypothetical protein